MCRKFQAGVPKLPVPSSQCRTEGKKVHDGNRLDEKDKPCGQRRICRGAAGVRDTPPQLWRPGRLRILNRRTLRNSLCRKGSLSFSPEAGQDLPWGVLPVPGGEQRPHLQDEVCREEWVRTALAHSPSVLCLVRPFVLSHFVHNSPFFDTGSTTTFSFNRCLRSALSYEGFRVT